MMTTRPYHEPYRGLPRELREQIYQYLFRTDGVIRICTDGLPGYSNAPYTHRTDENFVHTTGAPTYRSKIPFAVFLTNKAMSSEALAVLYSKSTFEFTEIHPYAVTTFFLRLRKEHRLMIKHVSFHAWLYYPKWDSLRTMNREPITAEKYIGQMSSMLRYLVREIKLDTLAVESEPLSYERDGQGVALQTQFHGHPLLQLTNARILREALLEGDLRVLKWRYDYSLVDFYRIGADIQRAGVPARYLHIFQSDGVYPHCVARALNGVNQHESRCTEACVDYLHGRGQPADGEDEGLIAEWEETKPPAAILVMRKRKDKEEKMKGKDYKALPRIWMATG